MESVSAEGCSDRHPSRLITKLGADTLGTDRRPGDYNEDVVALKIAATEPERKRLAGLCGRLGYSRRTVSGATVLKGTDIELHLISQVGEAGGEQEITMRVKGAPKGQTEFRFGPKSV
jgi:hypothetical protein